MIVFAHPPSAALAAGFALKEQSATAQGNAFAGATAGAEDLSYIFFNPAALSRFDGIQGQSVVNVILPSARLERSSASTVGGTSITGREESDDVWPDEVVPALYGVVELREDLRLGVALNAPFGLGSRYPRGWVGRYHGVESELRALNLNPIVAWQPLPWLSLGGGFQVQYIEAELTNALDLGTIGAGLGVPGAVPGAQDGFAQVQGNDVATGFNLGLLVEPRKGTRLGVAYRSAIDHELRGKADFTLDDAGTGAALQAGAGLFEDTRASAGLETPATLSFGIHQDLSERVAVMVEAAWTQWSSFDELRIQFGNNQQPDSITEEEWQDTWFFAVGATWRPTDRITLRTGVAHDQTPVKASYRTPRIPDNDRTWLSVGVGWAVRDWLTVDLAYSHIFVDDTEVRLRADEPGNAARGNLDASYDSSIDLLAASIRIVF